jgi:hypothetical protein
MDHKFRVSYRNYGLILYVSKETLELFGRMTPHLWRPSKPAASRVSVHSGIPNSSGAVAISITESAVATRLLENSNFSKTDHSF